MATPSSDRSLDPRIRTAAVALVVLAAQQVAARATRDALFLDAFPVANLPAMVAGGALASIAAALVATRALAAAGPRLFVPRAFLAGALLTLAACGLALAAPGAGAILLYLLVVALGPIHLAGFWSLINERLDPRSARRALGRIAAFGTLGGLAGGLVAERLAANLGVVALLPVLALAQAASAWSTARLAARAPAPAGPRPAAAADALPAADSLRRLAATPYLRNLALLVLGTATSAALLDFVFKAQVAASSSGDRELLRSFAWFYAAVSLLTFALQAFVAGKSLERAGLAGTMGVLPGAVLAGSAVAVVAPGPWSLGLVRGLEALFKGSLFRAGHELLYTPIPAAEKRATRLLIDVVGDRLGDLGGAAIVALAIVALPGAASPVLLALAALLAAATLGVIVRVQRGYVASLEAGLRAGVLRLDPHEVHDRTTYLTIAGTSPGATAAPASRAAPAPARTPLPDVSTEEGVRQALAMLCDDRLARRVVDRLVPVAGEHVETFVAALVDPATDFATRRRLPAVLVAAPGPRAADGLARGLLDARFEVRYRCGRALARVLETADGLWVDGGRVIEAVVREATLGRAVWESQRLLDQLDEPVDDAFVDDFLRERAGRSLEHVFTLLSLVLDREPLKIAFRGLLSGDRLQRGIALEYLDAVLPPRVHAVLWPHLEPERAPRPPGSASRDREQVLADLLASNASIEIQLDDLRRGRTPGA